MSPVRPFLAALLLAQIAGAALAADWQLVLSDRSRRVEIDRGSILSTDGGARVAWGRVVLTSADASASGYAMIKALNRYDCRDRSFVTVKRVYVDRDDNIVREESVPDQTPLTVARNSVDERMWLEVCKPSSAIDLQKLATGAVRPPVAPGAAVTPAAGPAATPAATPLPAAQKAATPAKPAPLAAARPEPATLPALIRAGETPPPAPSVSPSMPTPGETKAGAVPTPRKSALPALSALAARADAAASRAAARQSAPTAPASKTAAASKPAPPSKPVAASKPLAAPAMPAAKPAPARASTPVTTVARAEPSPQAARTRTKTDDARRAAPQAAVQSPTLPAAQASAGLEASGIRVTRIPATAAGWSYDGETGPQSWGSLRPEWRVCAEGKRQSPIDLRDGIAVDLAPVQFHYGRSGFRIRDTGNTLQVDVGEGMGITVRGVRYALERFTLHRPSQDRVGGMAHDMAIYLEHRSADGKQAILSLLLAAGNAPHPVLQTLWNNLPLDRGREFVPDAVIDLAQLVPADPGHFLYVGSLPTPPCTEDVLWVVMKQPLPIADDQLAVFARLYPRNGRPIQPANGRLLLESR